MSTLSDRIAQCALRHYESGMYDSKCKSNRGKPQSGKEWTVFAAIVVLDESEGSRDPEAKTTGYSDMWVVSCATGSKCTGLSRIGDNLNVCGGTVLHDSHAEVLCRRGLVLTLWKEVEEKLNREIRIGKDWKKEKETYDSTGNFFLEKNCGKKRELLETDCSPARSKLENDQLGPSFQFSLRPELSLHLYISDSPCGDASIYKVGTESVENESSGYMGNPERHTESRALMKLDDENDGVNLLKRKLDENDERVERKK
eukprot:CAMPEP_0113304050 /NCGR_PEP_ID=MMETSP0010_2-20120614/4206_1 /TAXON_ID=216773 ORGANISM="Corethron hystrix, Strain 308" /NCGR_SAMPLE_ID=MMETSP0010_2 /ASSEMBLY_ACC=CAM_ASM_000155 /LENGTH=256 /DNA_ID=CAMNT_0000158139 /DNA_START=21 /DNA_END=788 /DNA_ORIENTATION=+ /assembly_acc=CAM_ASM_000155